MPSTPITEEPESFRAPVTDWNFVNFITPDVSRLANCIGYSMSLQGVECTTDQAIRAAQRAISQGWHDGNPGS